MGKKDFGDFKRNENGFFAVLNYIFLLSWGRKISVTLSGTRNLSSPFIFFLSQELTGQLCQSPLILNAHHFSGGVHSQESDSCVHCRHGQKTGGNTSQSGSSLDVGTVGEFLIRNFMSAADALNDAHMGSVRSVCLVYGQL